MGEINRRAMGVPREKLLTEIKKANERKREVLLQRDRRYGADRPKIGSYMENIALPDLYGFDANDFYRDAALAMDVELRNKLFWLDNSLDDGLASLDINAGTMYYDITLFGLKINYTRDGVPNFERHALADNPDMSRLRPFDFYGTGEMPMVHKRFRELQKISDNMYGGEIRLNFPHFGRGPLDIYMQLRDYMGFVDDQADNPGYMLELLDYIVDARIRYNKLRSEFLGEAPPRTTTIDDDWINVPFISPAIFHELVLPSYRKIQENEGPVVRFHTCGNIAPVIELMLSAFDKLDNFDVTGWNNVRELDRIVNHNVKFNIMYNNTFVMVGAPGQHRTELEEAKRIAGHRRITVGAPAIVKLVGTIDDSLMAMNRFIGLAREILAE